jgi:hypothetical protein
MWVILTLIHYIFPDQKHVGGEQIPALSHGLSSLKILTGNDHLQALHKADGIKALL